MRGGGSTFKQAFSVTYLSGSGDLGPVVNYFSIVSQFLSFVEFVWMDKML